MAPAIKQKLHNVYEVFKEMINEVVNNIIFQVKELDSIIFSTEFDIPMFIQEYDMSINGLRYYQP